MAKEIKNEVKLEEKVVAEKVETPKIELTKEELDALIRKNVSAERQRAAMEQAKKEAEEKLKEETDSARQINLGIINTKKALEAEKKYRVIINPAVGEEEITKGSLSINGVVYRFEYNKPVTLPASALSILRNSKTFSTPEVVYEKDRSGNVVGQHSVPRKVQKRNFSSESL